MKKHGHDFYVRGTSFLLVFCILVLYLPIGGCGGGGGGGSTGALPSATAPPAPVNVPTATINAQLQLPAGSSLDPSTTKLGVAIHPSAMVSADGKSSVTVTAGATQLVVGSDSNGSPIMFGIYSDAGRPQKAPLGIDAASTAQALVFLHPQICTIDPAATETVLSNIQALAEYQTLVTLLQTKLAANPQVLSSEDPDIKTAAQNAISAYLQKFPPKNGGAVALSINSHPAWNAFNPGKASANISPSSAIDGLGIEQTSAGDGQEHFKITNSKKRWLMVGGTQEVKPGYIGPVSPLLSFTPLAPGDLEFGLNFSQNNPCMVTVWGYGAQGGFPADFSAKDKEQVAGAYVLDLIDVFGNVISVVLGLPGVDSVGLSLLTRVIATILTNGSTLIEVAGDLERGDAKAAATATVEAVITIAMDVVTRQKANDQRLLPLLIAIYKAIALVDNTLQVVRYIADVGAVQDVKCTYTISTSTSTPAPTPPPGPTPTPSPTPPSAMSWSLVMNTEAILRAVWGSSSTDVFAVGSNGTILHYDGNAWSQMNSGTTRSLYGIWGSSSTDVFAVGGNGTILHYDGNAWRAMNSGIGSVFTFTGVWGSSSTNVYAVVFDGAIAHYDGSIWNVIYGGPNFPSNGSYAIWGTSPSDIFTFGRGDAVLHYDGNSWSQCFRASEDLAAGWGASSTDVFAVGMWGHIFHFDGNTWNRMTVPACWGLQGIWGSSSTDVFAVGWYGAIFHYDGSTWSPMENGITVGQGLYGVWGSSSSNVFAVGSRGLAGDGSEIGGFIYHYGK